MTITPVPDLLATFETLTELIEAHPNRTSKHRYLDDEGQPYCVIAHFYVALGGDVATLADLTKDKDGGDKRVRSVWSELFDSSALFPSMRRSERDAEAFLVYALLSDVQHYQDHTQSADLGWLKAWRRALLKFNRFLEDPISGFLVQTGGAHGDLRDFAARLTATALERTK